MIEEVESLLKQALQPADRHTKWTSETPLLGSIPELDSMAVVTILTLIEDRFGIVIDDDEIGADIFQTVGTLARFIEGKA